MTLTSMVTTAAAAGGTNPWVALSGPAALVLVAIIGGIFGVRQLRNNQRLPPAATYDQLWTRQNAQQDQIDELRGVVLGVTDVLHDVAEQWPSEEPPVLDPKLVARLGDIIPNKWRKAAAA